MEEKKDKKVSLFIQCLVDSHYPDVAEAMVKVFEKLDKEIDYPEGQTCCGQAAYNNGYTQAARKAALHFFDVFDRAEIIVCPSGSCVHTVRHHYPELFKTEPEQFAKANDIASKTFEFSEYLRDVAQVETLESHFEGKVTCHDSCHLTRGLGVKTQPRELLAMVKGVELIEMGESDECCGFGGTFSVKYPEISGAMVDDKVDNILATGADYVVGTDMSCLMNIEGRLHRRGERVQVLHLAQVLAAEGGTL
ncbi:(Fe-S)-binding protein [Desulfopila sp. IMCC35008]|uniref:(Fe-S)-binding protein n=1 Tax=Desulfopila sp. IMCC35008 TaxID=2653858 RepID=UPI0013D304BD|nr:(Fe-S)-binding protein [Desulfopila sp. IMCC35008]